LRPGLEEERSIRGRCFERILMIRLSAVGDVVRTLPSVAVLRKNFPSARITWMVEEKSSDILSGQPELDEVMIFPRAAWTRSLARGRWWSLGRDVIGFVRGLRRERFDLVVDFHGILKSGFLSLLSGADVRVGFERGFCREGNYLFNNRRVALLNARVSRFERNRKLLEGVGLETRGCHLRPYVAPEDRRYASNFLKSKGLLARYPLIAINPGTSEKLRYKRWFPERYAQLADGLVKDLGAFIIVTWGPGELETAQKVQSLMESPAVVACPTSLKQLAGIYEHCHLYIGSDTGPMHMASLMGVPVVGIYGPTDPVLYAPYSGTPSVQVRKEVACSPCRNRKCEKLDCLKAIGYKDVLKAAKDLLIKIKEAS